MPEVLDTVATANLVEQYRELKVSVASMAADIGILRDAIQARVEVEAYEDDLGYARIKTRDAATTYVAKDISILAKVWSESDVAAVKTCGAHLVSLAKTKQSCTYLEIR